MSGVEEHMVRVSEHVGEFHDRIQEAVSAAISDISEYIERSTDSTESGRGVLASSNKNAAALGELPKVMRQALSRSGYYDLISDFAVSMQDQVGYFRKFYEEDAGPLGLPEMAIDKDGLDMLTSAASLSVVAMESSAEDAAARLSRLAPRMLGNESVSSMIRETQTVVRRVSDIKSMALDQVMLFYRLLANSVYKVVEDEGRGLTYSLVGPEDSAVSGTCSAILAGKNSYTWPELHNLKNDDETSFAHSGGHFACRHWFRATGLA